ncbi:MAG: helix-turn-helix domain-containing protein [Ramlibacter sp.]|nr:helix-turn-helix domain-containing protein [Cryobacterium sp.]
MLQQPQTLISSVQRALRLVDIVADATRPLPVKAIARASGLSLGTAYNLTRTLVHEGYLAAEPDGLVLGARFPSLRGGSGPGVFLACVRQTLRRVAQEHASPAHLARYLAGEVRVVDSVDAVGAPRSDSRDDATHAAVSRQILALLSRDQRADYVARHPPLPLTRHAAGTGRALLNHRQPETDAPGARDQDSLAAWIAVPVRAPGLIAALAVAVPGNGIGADQGAVARQLRAAAAGLSSRLGAAPVTHSSKS